MENKENGAIGMTDEKKVEDVMEGIRKENENGPEMAGKIHVEALVDGEKKEERDHECDGFVVMTFKGTMVEIMVHGCCIAQIAAAIDDHEILGQAAMLVANRRNSEKAKKLLRDILKGEEAE